ncbi:hypothetical protein [Serinicoccus sp. LYQ131]|uniref:hypothetical protein n=1 Tax=Serinicoccus sp. LYQ131 TaxID=3378797 RepID=UPI003853CC40
MSRSDSSGPARLLHATTAGSFGLLLGTSAASLLTYVIAPGPWHLLVQWVVGVGCAWLAVRLLRRRPLDRRLSRRRTVISAGLAPPLVGSALLVLLLMVALEPSAPRSLEGLFGSIWLTWWFLVPIGVMAALMAWIWTLPLSPSRPASG